jgi:4-amino-4-deoxy-L-arabinose transferase-like glycosyltransferase
MYDLRKNYGARLKHFLLRFGCPITLFILTLLISGIFSIFGSEPHHDGVLLKPAIDVYSGKVLFKETFTRYGALTTILQALSLGLFGKYLIVIRLLTAFFYGLTSVLLWFIFIRILPKWLSYLSCIIWLFLAPYYIWQFLPWSSVYSLFFQILSLYLLILYIENRGSLYVFLSGISAALTFWCRQPVGILLFFALFLAIILDVIMNRKDKTDLIRAVLLYNLGFILCNSLFISWLYYNEALNDWYLQSIKLAYMFAESVGLNFSVMNIYNIMLFPYYKSITPYYGFWHIDPLYIVWGVLPIICLLLSYKVIKDAFIVKEISTRPSIILSIIIVSIASWAQYYPVLCIRHTYWAATPMIGLTMYFFWNLLKRKRVNIRICIFMLLILLVFGFDVSYRVVKGIQKLSAHKEEISNPEILSGIWFNKDDAFFHSDIGSKLIYYSKKGDNRNVITLTRDALYLTYINNQTNFHKVYIGVYNPLYPEYKHSLSEYIKNSKPIIIAYNRENKIEGYKRAVTYEKENLSILVPVELLE